MVPSNPNTSRVAALLVTLTLALPVRAEPLVPAGADPDLDAQMARHGRQFYAFNALPFGLSLDAHVPDAVAASLVDVFLEQDETDDVREATGLHPFEILSSYGEYGDLGFFGGVAVAATAYEYLTLKRDGAPAAQLARARARVVRAAESWHIFYVVTGGGGLVARGIRRMEPEDPEDPPVPVVYPEMVPLFDETDGTPLPKPKNNGTYRWDNSGGVLPDGVWIWKDSCSKDQLVGQVFALCALYDAMKDDPDIDQALVTRLQEDARLVGEMLMEMREISTLETPLGAGLYDLIIMDADGRATYHHDLNPLSLEKFYFPPDAESYNLFNLFMAIGVVKGLHHVTGDEKLERYLYEELLAARDFLGKAQRWDGDQAIDYIYSGTMTNFDNPDMTSIALWLALYHETDDEVSAVLRAFLEDGWWRREGESHTAALSKQPLWHAVYLALTDRGTPAEVVDELRALLRSFSLGPYWDVARINCDEAEIAARECLAIDGETVLYLEGMEDDGRWMATEALDPSIRPTSNFDARSNPFRVNGGGGGTRLNPGGDLLASYWIARYVKALAPGEVNRSPNARAHMPVGGWPVVSEEDAGSEPSADVADAATPPPDVGSPDVSDVTPDGGAPEHDAGGSRPELETVGGGGGGCGAAVGHGDDPRRLLLPAWLALALMAVWTARRRQRGLK